MNYAIFGLCLLVGNFLTNPVKHKLDTIVRWIGIPVVILGLFLGFIVFLVGIILGNAVRDSHKDKSDAAMTFIGLFMIVLGIIQEIANRKFGW